MKKSIKIIMFIACAFLLESIKTDTQAVTVTNNPYVVSYNTISIGSGWQVAGFSSGLNCDKLGPPPLYFTSCPNSGFYAVNTTIDGSLWTSYWVLCTQRPNSLLGSCAHFTNYRSSYNCTYTTSVASWSACNSSGVQYPTAYNYATVAGSSCVDLAPTSQSCSVGGSCGAAQGNYLATDTVWRSPACVSGNPSVNVVATSFLSMGETRNWTCNGISGGSTASCSATRASNIINGVCGSGNTTYPSTTTAWPQGTSFCSGGTASPVNPSFPAIGTTASWQCIGSGAGRNPDPTCTATRNYATPDVTLTATPANFTDVNGGTMTVPATVQTNLTWSISNEPLACGSSCICDLTEVETASTILNMTYPTTASSLRTIPISDRNYSITCRNTQGLSDTDTETVAVSCTNQTGPAICDKTCGTGNQIVPTLDVNCNLNNVNTGNSCNNGNCPAGTDFKEVRP